MQRNLGLWLWCLVALSTIFQLYHGSSKKFSNKLEKDIFLKRCMYKNYLIFGTTNLLSEKKMKFWGLKNYIIT
jgi:hypothetical protein